MRVSTLRRKLDEKGLDVDGSREMLISRLEDGDGSENASIKNSAGNASSENAGNPSNEDNCW
jgi:hypothetical protein